MSRHASSPLLALCLQTMVVTDQVFVGHLGVTELAAAALGNTVRFRHGRGGLHFMDMSCV